MTPRSVAKSRTYKLKLAQHHPEWKDTCVLKSLSCPKAAFVERVFPCRLQLWLSPMSQSAVFSLGACSNLLPKDEIAGFKGFLDFFGASLQKTHFFTPVLLFDT